MQRSDRIDAAIATKKRAELSRPKRPVGPPNIVERRDPTWRQAVVFALVCAVFVALFYFMGWP